MWQKCTPFLLFIFFFLSADKAAAQKKLVIMGSSTAAGTGSSSYANSWAGKIQAYFRQNMADGLDTVTTNIAVGGYSTYHEMPTGFIPPAGRPLPDPNANVTRALSFTPDVVVINLPSNDITAGYSKQECMDNLRLMYATITAGGAKCFIATTQPRNLGLAARTAQRELVDSINNNFGVYAINFWSDLVSPLLDPANIYTINPPVSAGDGTHVNDLGHNFLFLQVRDKQIFTINTPLPLLLKEFEAAPKNNAVLIKWITEEEEPATRFEVQRSADGQVFETLLTQQGLGAAQGHAYSRTDPFPFDGTSFYRLKIIENNREFYSKISTVTKKPTGFSISRLYKENAAILVAVVRTKKDQAVSIFIYNTTGAIVYKQSAYITGPSATIPLPIDKLPAGQYYLSFNTTGNNECVTAGFVK